MPRLPQPRFNLKSPKSKSETLIILFFRYRGFRIQYSTSLTILPKEWNFKTQRPITMIRRPYLLAIQHQLDDFANWCRSIYIDHDYGNIKPKVFKELLDQKSGKTQKEAEIIESLPKINFLTFIEQELENLKNQGIRKSSLKPYKVHINVIKAFAQDKGGFSYEDVDWNFRLELIDWLAQKNIKLSYGNKTLGILRRLLERARKKGLHGNTKYHGAGWEIPQKKAVGEKIILLPEELQLLADMKLGGLLKKVRDLFLIGAGTGQRYGDYSRYQPHHFYHTAKGIPILSIISQKTDTPVKVPLNLFPWLLPVLEEYNYTSPKFYMQKLNDGIKILGKKAGINNKVLVVNQLMERKPRIEKLYLPKYELLTTHTCRRSFATNLYRRGFPLSQIMPMTGHTTEGNLRIYIGIDAEENAERVALDMVNNKNKI